MSETMTAAAPAAEITAETPAGDSNLEDFMKDIATSDVIPDPDVEDKPETDDPDEDTTDEELVTLKVNGKNIKKPLSEVIGDAQKYAASEQKLETLKTEVETARKLQESVRGQQEAIKSLLGVLQRGDIQTISEFVEEKLAAGPQFKRAIVNYALQIYEESKMSPEQREAVENKKLVQKYKQDAEARAEMEQKRSFEHDVNKWTETLARDVPVALKTVGLPDNAFIRNQIVQTWREAIDRGQNPTATAVANYVKTQLEEARMLNTPPAEQVKQQRPRATKESVSNGRRDKPAVDEPYISFEEWRRTRPQ